MQEIYPVKIIADILTITERRVQQLAKEGVLPKAEKGKYPFVACVQAYIKYLQNNSRLGLVGEPEEQSISSKDLAFHRARFEKARADKTEIEVEVLKESLIDKAETQKVFSDAVMAFRAKMLILPKRLAGQVLTIKTFQECEMLLKQAICEALQELALYDIYPSNDQAGDPSCSSTPNLIA